MFEFSIIFYKTFKTFSLIKSIEQHKVGGFSTFICYLSTEEYYCECLVVFLIKIVSEFCEFFFYIRVNTYKEKARKNLFVFIEWMIAYMSDFDFRISHQKYPILYLVLFIEPK